MATKAFADIFRETMETDEFWAEKAILEFTSEIYKEMKRQNKSSSDLARILNYSPAYMTKIFRGNANFTIHSMVKLSRALGCRLHIKVAREDSTVKWIDILPNRLENANYQWKSSDNYISVDKEKLGVASDDPTQSAA